MTDRMLCPLRILDLLGVSSARRGNSARRRRRTRVLSRECIAITEAGFKIGQGDGDITRPRCL